MFGSTVSEDKWFIFTNIEFTKCTHTRIRKHILESTWQPSAVSCAYMYVNVFSNQWRLLFVTFLSSVKLLIEKTCRSNVPQKLVQRISYQYKVHVPCVSCSCFSTRISIWGLFSRYISLYVVCWPHVVYCRILAELWSLRQFHTWYSACNQTLTVEITLDIDWELIRNLGDFVLSFVF